MYVHLLQINGQHVSWEHLRRVYNRSRTTSGLSLLPKLTREHMDLNSYSRMRVNLAAQVNVVIACTNNNDYLISFIGA